MFGFVRFVLAWVVAFSHLTQTFKYSSALSVYAFYMLSGFLMTLIMHERYHYTFSGIKRYAINRGLRIYPQYWLVCILALLFIGLISPDFASTIHPALRLPQTTHEIISNIFIFGLYPESIQPMARLAPQAWALHVELIFYLLIGLVLGRNYPITLVWLLASIGYHVGANIYGWPRYSPVLAASIAFSFGSMLYHVRPVLKKILPYSKNLTLFLLIGYLVFVAASSLVSFGSTKIPFYINLVVFAVTLYQLSMVPRYDGKLLKIDKWLGDFSYPVYLAHWVIGVYVAYFISSSSNLKLFIYSAPIIFIVSYLLAKLVEQPVEVIRRKIAVSST